MKKLAYRKFCLIIISLIFVSIHIQAQNGWILIDTMANPRVGATASVVDGKIFLIGGWASVNLNTNEMYDPSTNMWTSRASMPTPRGFLSSVVIDGKIYVIAGGYPIATKKLEVYDAATDVWTTKADLNVARINGRAAAVGGKIYVFAGNPNTRSCEYYDTQTDTWTYFSDFPETSGGIVSVAAYNGLIYVFGGGYYTGLNTVYIYNPQTDEWTRKSDMPTPRTVAQACLMYDKIFVIGGATGEYVSSAANEMYDPTSDTFLIGEPMPVPSAFLSCAVVNNKIYTFEGTEDWVTSVGRVWKYDPLLDTLVAPFVPVELTSFTASANGKEVTLSWTTATELNNFEFEVQRSFEGSEFVTIGVVYGKGTTTERQDYTYCDKNLSDGKYSYRLKQVDYNGSYEYSDDVEVDFRAFKSYLLDQNYPNPFNPATTIGFGLQNKSNVKITILNAIGEEVAVVLNEERESGYHTVEFNAANLPSGVYFYQLQAGGYIEMKKMLLLK